MTASPHRRSRAIAIAATLVAVACTGALLFLLLGRSDAPIAGGSGGTAAGLLPRIEWPDGTRHVYALRYESRDAFDAFAATGVGAASESTSSDLTLEAVVAITGDGAGSTPDAARAVFEVLSCDDAASAWRVAGSEVWTTDRGCDAMLRGARLGVEIAATGQTRSIADPDEADAPVQSLLQTIWLTLGTTLPEAPVAPDTPWWAQEKTTQGVAGFRYAARSLPGKDQDLLLERALQAYVDLRVARDLEERPRVDAAGTARFTIGRDHGLREARGDESLRVVRDEGGELLRAEKRFALVWQRAESVDATPRSASWTPRAPDSILSSAKVREALLDQRIDGLTAEELVAEVAQPSTRTGSEAQARFAWRATALLEKDPALAWSLFDAASGKGVPASARALALDLLASAGHAEAQAVLRRVFQNASDLESDQASDRHLYQRLSLLEQPELATAEMVARHYQTHGAPGDENARFTAAYSLGAITNRLAEADDPEARAAALRFHRLLADGVDPGADPAVLAHEIAALGATRLTANLDLLSPFAAHESATVRRSTANALARVPSADPPPALIDLLRDGDQGVQRNAVRGAAPHAEVYREVADASATGQLDPLNVRPVLDLVRRGRASFPGETTALLESLIAAGIPDDLDRELAHRLLGDARDER
ncbi:MAG: HEAT repeat domain-containing protein [Myxococcota bacterium]